MTVQGQGGLIVIAPAPAQIIPVTVYGESVGESTNTGTGLISKLQITKTGAMPAGNYKLHWSYLWRRTSTLSSFVGEIRQDGLAGTLLWHHEAMPVDSASTQRYSASGTRRVTLDAMAHTFDIAFAATTAGPTSGISNAVIWLQQIL